MHEMSLCQGIFDSVVPVAKANGATKITEITLTIGDMTMDDPLLEGVKLTMNFVTPKSRCLDCGNEFEHDRFHLHCPKCNSDATILIAGRELEVASMEIESPDDEEDEE